MEKFWQEQLRRVDHLLRIINSENPYEYILGLSFYDIIIFSCQNMWHLKDWIINDSNFHAINKELLKDDIHSSECLLICSDIANGSKHFKLKNIKKGGKISERRGTHINSTKGIFKEFYYIDLNDHNSKYYGMEIRDFLNICRQNWEKIINKHNYSDVIISSNLR